MRACLSVWNKDYQTLRRIGVDTGEMNGEALRERCEAKILCEVKWEICVINSTES